MEHLRKDRTSITTGRQRMRRIGTVGLAEAICARPRMEDRHAVSVAPDGVTIVAVFDGHGGSRVAEAAAGRVVDVVASSVKRDPRSTGHAWAPTVAARDTPAPPAGAAA